MNKILIFAYGTLIVPEMTQQYFQKTFTPLRSVFIKGYKLVVEHANSKKYPKYHYIKLVYTGVDTDVIPGSLIEIDSDFIETIDKWEGKGYIRKNIVCYTRELYEIDCQTYIQNE